MRIVGERPGEPAWLEVEWRLRAPDLLRLRARGVEEARGVEAGERRRGFVRDESPAVERYAPIGRTMIEATEWIGQLFLALIKMVVVPLVFFSLLVGVASLGDFRRLGRLGLRTIVFFLLTTVIALTIGVGLANVVRPGKLVDERDRAALLASYEDAATDTVADAAEAPGFTDQLLAIVPSNPLEALAEGNMLQIIFFALMLGIALTFMEAKRAKLVVDVSDRLNDAMVMLVHIVMKLAPYGVAALLFKVAGTTGPTVLLALGAYALVVLAGLFVHLGGTYLGVVRLGARLPFGTFLRAIRPALLVGFSTSSSSATLPVTMECCEDNLGVSKQVTSFVLPLGATVNMDGTALYQGVAALFIAQIYDMDLSLAEQGTVILSATLASIGAAGVPGAGMITLAMVLTAVGVPTEGLALVLGVDRLLDMFRTATNIAGDCTATAFMARLEGEQLRPLSAADDAADPERGFEGRLDHEQSKVEPDDP
jgi:Na+/H+-dicarboxylate symporter